MWQCTWRVTWLCRSLSLQCASIVWIWLTSTHFPFSGGFQLWSLAVFKSTLQLRLVTFAVSEREREGSVHDICGVSGGKREYANKYVIDMALHGDVSLDALYLVGFLHCHWPVAWPHRRTSLCTETQLTDLPATCPHFRKSGIDHTETHANKHWIFQNPRFRLAQISNSLSELNCSSVLFFWVSNWPFVCIWKPRALSLGKAKTLSTSELLNCRVTEGMFL